MNTQELFKYLDKRSTTYKTERGITTANFIRKGVCTTVEAGSIGKPYCLSSHKEGVKFKTLYSKDPGLIANYIDNYYDRYGLNPQCKLKIED